MAGVRVATVMAISLVSVAGYIGYGGLGQLFTDGFLASGPLVKGALKKGQVDVANLFSTDVDIVGNNWVVLDDPRQLIPAQHIVPVIRSAKADAKVRKALARLGAALTTTELTKLDDLVDNQKKNPTGSPRRGHPPTASPPDPFPPCRLRRASPTRGASHRRRPRACRACGGLVSPPQARTPARTQL
jgi:hypothetical protein